MLARKAENFRNREKNLLDGVPRCAPKGIRSPSTAMI